MYVSQGSIGPWSVWDWVQPPISHMRPLRVMSATVPWHATVPTHGNLWVHCNPTLAWSRLTLSYHSEEWAMCSLFNYLSVLWSYLCRVSCVLCTMIAPCSKIRCHLVSHIQSDAACQCPSSHHVVASSTVWDDESKTWNVCWYRAVSLVGYSAPYK